MAAGYHQVAEGCGLRDAVHFLQQRGRLRGTEGVEQDRAFFQGLARGLRIEIEKRSHSAS